MPFIDLNTNNASGANPVVNNTNSSQPVVANTNDDSTATINPSLDLNRLAAEGALPVLPPKFNENNPPLSEESSFVPATDQSASVSSETVIPDIATEPVVNTLDLTTEAPSIGNDVRQVQGASFEELPDIMTPAPEVSGMAAPIVSADPLMEVTPADSTPEAPAEDDMSDVLDAVKNSRTSLAAYKPVSAQIASTTTEPVEQTVPVPSEEIVQVPPQPSVDTASSVGDSTSEEPKQDTFRLGIENSPVTPDTTASETEPETEPETQVAEPAAQPVVDLEETVQPVAVDVNENAVAEVASNPTLDATPASTETQVPLVDAPVETPTIPTQQIEPAPVVEPVVSPLPVADTLPVLPEAVEPVLESIVENNLQSRSYSLNEMLTEAVNMGASDLHLTANYRAMARVDGKLSEIRSQILTHEDILTMLSDVVANHTHIDLQHDLDIDLSYQLDEPKARFRTNIFYQQGTIGAVFRVIPEHIRTVEELKLPAMIKEFTTLPQGLVLVTGPTGSGKTTTLAALVNQINLSEPKHIITVEDPIEYVYPKGAGLVDQRAVYIDTPDWHTALRAVLRQDPNVVLIGEMRDVETMEAALTIAETGHLVFSTLHTNGAAQTIDRIIDAFPEEKHGQVRTQLASVLTAVVSQRLIPVAGGGRRVATEILVVTPAVKNAIREQKVYQIDNIIQTSADLGMHSLEKSLVNLVREGAISPEAAQNYANRPDDVITYLSKN